MKEKNTMHLPVTFSTEEFNDNRFVKARLKVAHTGANRKRSAFDAKAFNKAKKTLKNIPLIAYIDAEEGDFKGHERKLVITENGVTRTFMGKPIGIIPETNNYQFFDDGEKTWVMVDAYIWTHYAEDALFILEQSDGKKAISMEIDIFDYNIEGKSDITNITDFAYLGVAVLGDNYMPGMEGASLELFSQEENLDEFDLAELNKAIQKNKEEYSMELEKLQAEYDALQEKCNTLQAEYDALEATKVELENTNAEHVGNYTALETKYSELENSKTELQENFNTLEEAHNHLGAEYSVVVEKVKDSILSNFSDLEEKFPEEFAATVENSKNYEDLELRLFALKGKKADMSNFSFGTSNAPVEPPSNDWTALVKKGGNQ